jgi:homoaconitase/3-isopropylmalate dehydratase large subunit
MSVEAGAVAALFVPDEATFAYLDRRPYTPAPDLWNRAVGFWRTFSSDNRAAFDRELEFDASRLVPQVTWGTSPEDVVPVTGRVPDPSNQSHLERRRAMLRSLDYMDLVPGMPMIGTRINKVFIGSCTIAVSRPTSRG